MDNHKHHSTPSKLPPKLYMTIPEFTLESGETLAEVVVAFTFHGLLNAKRDNAVVVCHALSGSAAVAEWWPSLVGGPKAVLDPGKYCIICCNSLGSPYGSSSPLTYRDTTGNECYGPSFPKTTIRDDVRAHKYVLDILGVKSVQCVIGPSMGGMLALEWAFYGRDYVRALILIATAAGQGAWQLAWNENQRNTIRCDAKYRDGWYGNDPPLAGLAAARMAALMTYRSHYSFEQRFGRRLQAEPSGGVKTAGLISNNAITDGTEEEQRTPACGTPEPGEDKQQQQQQHQNNPPPLFSVQSYLRHHGATFNARFDANCYLHILDKMDTHDITRGRYQQPPLSQEEEEEALGRVLGRVWQPTLVVGIPSDGLYPIREQQALVEGLPNSVFGAIDSREGHDAFLIETAQLDGLVGAFFERLGGLEVEAERVARLEKRRDAVVVWAGSF